MKYCGRCDRIVPKSDFHRNKSRKDGLATQCKDCHKEYQEEYRKRTYVKEKQAKTSLERYHRLTDGEKRRYNSNARRKGWHLTGTYNKTLEWYSRTLEEQGGGCAICQKSPGDKEFLCVDHDHKCCPGQKSCGECVRGLLCRSCNMTLGFIEREEFLDKCKQYITKWAIEKERDENHNK